jgi:hypothetical protein
VPAVPAAEETVRVTELADGSVPALEEPTLAPAVCVTGWPVPVADGGSSALAGEPADLAEDAAVFTVFTAVLAVEPTADWTVDWIDPNGGLRALRLGPGGRTPA